MGRKTIPGIFWDQRHGCWEVDKQVDGARVRKRCGQDFEEAQGWLIDEIARIKRERSTTRQRRTFASAAAHYLEDHADKLSIETEIILLNSVMPYIGETLLDEVTDAALQPYVIDRREAGRKNKTINLALAIVRRILNLAARKYRDGNAPWLTTAPLIQMLPLTDQRPPYQLSWAEQRRLLPALPDHLAKMALYTLNAGCRDEVVCGLRWDWEVEVAEIGQSVFVVPVDQVKGERGKKQGRVLVHNRVGQSIIDAQKGLHKEFVFPYQRGRHEGRVDTMNNTGWQSARTAIGLPDLHVHDLRHTVGMRLREAGVAEETRADLLWHKRKGMPAHYSVAQILELHAAIELVADEANCMNRTLESIVRESREKRAAAQSAPVTVPDNEKRAKCANT